MPDHHHHHHYYHGENSKRDGYAFHAGEPGPGPNQHKLYRNRREGKLAGVCAGLADYFGTEVGYVRLAVILGAVFFSPFVPLAYLAMAIFLRPGDPIATRYESPEEERFWRTYSVKPKATFSELKHRFRALDARIGDMERVVTTSEFNLRREFRDLERGH